MDSICASCHWRKTFPWANCKLPFPQGYGVEPLEKWFASAEAGGCSLYQLGTAVAKDAISNFGYDDAFALSSMFDNEIDSVIRLTLTLNCGSDQNMTNQIRMVILARDGSLIGQSFLVDFVCFFVVRSSTWPDLCGIIDVVDLELK
ncbi:HET domain-containing protein [Colletotrichum kahawae]|uniref:HET domain-containing protein n=1 Tax=Colletotrichum kahawae TaxID=34407 RepID=A0AAD9Y945_COLKA|nr:HET domain-containing protein [Colletotrichum kahawae]